MKLPKTCLLTCLAAGLGLLSVAWLPGCGQIADKDRIRIAKLDNEYITRGELARLIYDMPDTERPNIRNRGDLLRVLNEYIDNKIKIPLGQQLAEEGKITVPREMAREQYFSQCGDDEETMRAVWNMQVPASGEMTPLMEVYKLTPESMKAMKALVEQETDKVVQKLQGEQAVAYLAVQDFKAGKLKLDPEAVKREYNVRKSELKRLEWMSFVAIRFPASMEGAAQAAAKVRERLESGEDFDAIVKEFQQKNPGFIIQSEIENNPSLQRFKGFWVAASGAEPGTVVGPIYLPSYQQMAQDAKGQSKTVQMPDAYLILKVLDHKPEAQLSLEEAQPMLAPPILVAGEMKLLREQHGVEIYEDKLPDPGQFMNEPSPMFQK
jgi:PHD/YefM family antitoxin component YafN of YafNO toxin-antitoxin module